MSTILSVKNLSIQYKNQSCCSVNSLSFDLKKGENALPTWEFRVRKKHGCLDNHGKNSFHGRYRFRKYYV